ncbi:hypothetical protein [Flavobacterium ovatum]|uniref:hypothetical protein n=1 Tax=Flavobacterium ovatum TaxID=1928857 RepID=UPI00344E7D95
MNKIDLLYGFLIGFITTAIGCFVFIQLFTEWNFAVGIQIMRSQGYLGKIITLGSILNLIAFTILLKFNRDLIAKGVILAVILMTILTLFL